MSAFLTVGTLSLLLCLPLEGQGGRPAARSTQSELEELSARATEAQQRGDFREAAKAYQQILRLRPDLVSAKLNLGLMQFSLKNYAAAVQTFNAVLQESPSSIPANLFLGESLLRQEKPEDAVRYLKRARSLDPHNQEALRALGQAYSLLRDYAQANGWYYELAEVNPQSADAWYGLGISYLALGGEAATQMARIDSASPYSQLLLAELLEQQSRREDAVKLYKKLATIAPLFPCYRTNVGLGLARLDESDSAERLFQAELHDHPACSAAQLGLARVTIERGSFPQAMNSLENLWALDRDFVEANAASVLAGLAPQKQNALKAWLQSAWNGGNSESSKALADWLMEELEGNAPSQGEKSPARTPADRVAKSTANPALLFSQGRYTQCAEALAPMVQKLPPSDLLLLARCAFLSGDYRTCFLSSGRAAKMSPKNLEALYWRTRTAERLAGSSLLRTSLLSPNSPKVHILLGDAYREGKHFTEAEAEYRKAIQISPKDFAAHFGLALNLYQNFKIDQAEMELRTVMDLRTGDPDASYLMGRVLVLKHQYDAARPLLVLALKGNPNNVPHVYAMLGKIDAAQGRLVEARAELQKSLEADDDGSYHYQLSRVYLQLGNKEAAVAALAQSEAIRKASAERAEKRLGLPRPPKSDQ